MTTAIAKVTTTALSTGTFTEEQKALIKRTICKGATDDELALFVTTCQRLGLDPFARQIFAIKRKDNRAGIEVMSIQVSIDGFRLVAERTGCYAPGRRTEFEYDDKGKLACAVAYVKKFSHGQWHEVPEEASWSEYAQRSPLWERMPRVMLAKCAEARALRRAFPNELAGVYAPEEMDQAASPAAQFRAPDAAIDVEVVPSDATRGLFTQVVAAGTLEELQMLVPALSRVPKADPGYAELRQLYGQRKAQLERPRAVPANEERFYDPETGEVIA